MNLDTGNLWGKKVFNFQKRALIIILERILTKTGHTSRSFNTLCYIIFITFLLHVSLYLRCVVLVYVKFLLRLLV